MAVPCGNQKLTRNHCCLNDRPPFQEQLEALTRCGHLDSGGCQTCLEVVEGMSFRGWQSQLLVVRVHRYRKLSCGVSVRFWDKRTIPPHFCNIAGTPGFRRTKKDAEQRSMRSLCTQTDAEESEVELGTSRFRRHISVGIPPYLIDLNCL